MMNAVTVEIAGNRYQIKTDEDPAYVMELADFINTKVLEVKRDTGASTLDSMTVVALEVADRYYKEKQQQKRSAASKKKKTAKLPPPELATLL